MAEKYESFETYLIKHISEQLPDLSQPVYAEVNKVFYEENVGGVLYQFEFEFPSIDDMPLKKSLSGKDIPDFDKVAKDTIIKVQRVFPDGEVIVDFEFGIKGKRGDWETRKSFEKSLTEGKGMKGVLLDYYDTFPVETTLPTTLENDITIPDTPKNIDTPKNVVDDFKLSGFGGNTNVKGSNIAYVDVEEIFPYVEFDRRINPKLETDIDLIKQTVLDKGYMYDTGLNSSVVFPMYIDSQGNIMMGEGNHRIRALYEVAQETGQKIYIPINLDTGFQLDNVAEATKITNSSTVKTELNKLFKEFEEIAGLQKGDTANWIITTGDRKGRIVNKAVSYLSPGNGLPQSSVARFLNAIGINAITYDELPDNSIYKTGVNTFTDTPDRPLGPGAAHIEEILNANTQLVNELPLSQTVKNQFDNFLRTRARNLATPGGAIDAVDIWELAVTGLMITTIALSEIDEIPTIFKRTATNMFNSMTAPYNIPPVPLEEYDLNYEFINKVLTTGEKVMPTDIIIKKVGDVVKGAAETGAVTGFGYVPPNLTKTDTMETTQKIQPGVQEEKMFEQAKPKKSKATGGAGAKIL